MGDNSYCECNDANLDWSPISKTCSETVEVVIPMLFPEGQKTLLKAALDAVNGNLSRRRKKRSTRKNRFKRAITNTDFDQIMQHGCHCIKLDQDFTGLGGRTAIDSMDGLCQDWTVARRCITLNGGTCHNQDISLDSYTVNINKNTGEVDCSPNDGLLDDCVKDACAIDALNVQYILQQLRDEEDPFLLLKVTRSLVLPAIIVLHRPAVEVLHRMCLRFLGLILIKMVYKNVSLFVFQSFICKV